MSLSAWWRSVWATPYVAPAGIPHDAVVIADHFPDVRKMVPVLRHLGWVTPDAWAAALAPACAKHGITTKLRLAAFLANIGHETGGGAVLAENLNYTSESLTRLFGNRITPDQARQVGRIPGKQPADQRGIANIIYGGEWGRRNLGNTMPGDGWRFRGRGAMQTTGRANYQRTADAMGVPLDDAFLARMETQAGAAESAAFFWEWAKCHPPADAGDIARVRRIVNGGTFGLEEVRRGYAKALAALS